MRTATIREVQHHFGRVLAWVENGEEVQITRRNKSVARLVPHPPELPASVDLPDFAARARAIWGESPAGSPLSEVFLADRGERI